MGFTPRQVDEMSLWELTACADGYAKANGASTKAEALGEDEHEELMRKYG